MKELRGQGGLKGGKKEKMPFSPKPNLSNSYNSRSGTRGKSPPKKAKLGRQREGFGTATPKASLPSSDPVLCSTPKNSQWKGDSSARGRKAVDFEHITPIRGWVETSDRRQKWRRTDKNRGGVRKNERPDSHSVSYQSARQGLVVGQPTDEQLHLWEEQKENVASLSPRESGFFQKAKENQESILKGRNEDGGWLEHRKVKSYVDTFSRVERQNERVLQKADENDKERHLRWYHQQLQQFMPSTSSSSLFKSSSFSSSNQASVSPALCSSLQHPDLPVSAFIHHGLENKTRVQVRAEDVRGLLHFPSGKLESGFHTYGDSDDERGPSWEGTEAIFGQDRGGREREDSVKETDEARVRKENKTPAGIDGGERRRAWVATSEASDTDRMTGAIPSYVEAQVSHNCDSGDREVDKEGQEIPYVPADDVWCTEEGGVADSWGAVPTLSNSLINSPCFHSILQRAPAERPLSPACDHTNTRLTQNKVSDVSSELKQTNCTSNMRPLPQQNTSSTVIPSIHKKKKQWLVNASTMQLLNGQSFAQPLTTSVTQTGCKTPTEPDNKRLHKQVYSIKVSPQAEAYSDSQSYIMDPLSTSVVQVDQQVTTDSFLQGVKDNISLCQLTNEMGEVKRSTCTEMVGNVRDDEYADFCSSLLEQRQPKTGKCGFSQCVYSCLNVKCEHVLLYPGRMKHPIPEGMWVSLQDKDNTQKPQTVPDIKASITPLNSSICTSMQTSVQQSATPSVQHSSNIDASRSCNPNLNDNKPMPSQYAYSIHSKPALSILTQQSECVLGPLNHVPCQCRTVHSNNFKESNNSFQANCCTENATSEQIRPLMHLSTLEDLDHDKCVFTVSLNIDK